VAGGYGSLKSGGHYSRRSPGRDVVWAAYWRGRARELRAIAEGVKEDRAKEEILKCAADYENLAQRAEARLRDQKNSN
jgi:hypothetical protein